MSVPSQGPVRAWLAAPVALALMLGGAGPAAGAEATVVDGHVRFELITPSLVRFEYAKDGDFEDRASQVSEGRLPGAPRFTTRVRRGVRIISTRRMTLRWKRGSGPLSAGDLRVRVGRRTLRPRPGPNPAPLGGWRRSLDIVNSRVPLHEGMLSRAGWYLLDDSETALIKGAEIKPRPAHRGGYQDLYLFAYGRDYERGLRDLRRLTGAAPLLPRKAFGVWFSRWWPYGEDEWRQLVARFRSERVPLDTISIDTDFKRIHDPAGAAIAAEVVGAPGGQYSWNGWDWNSWLYPDPTRFIDWARGQGLEVGLNVHPSISSSDPRYEQTQQRAGGGLRADDGCRVVQADPNGLCMVFDWTDPRQLDAYMRLHRRFEQSGPVFWWLDWCCDGSSAEAPGLTPDTWINRAYANHQRERNSRWPAFSRIGGSFQAGFGEAVGNGAFAEHRYTLHFTGDTCATWEELGFAAEFSAAEASIGMPYVSHDIGTFHAKSPTDTCDKDLSPYLTPRENSLPPEMYVRWLQLGAFQPLDRLHSHHGKRLPWEYDEPYASIAAEFLRLRERLVPYLYTLAANAHRTGVPIVRPLYLGWPGRPEAYRNPSEYTLGDDVLVAPVAAPGDPASVSVWFPPGKWIDWFTGERHAGPGTEQLEVPLDRAAVFVRKGAVIPTQPVRRTTPAGPAPKIVLAAQRGNGTATIYDDSGRGFAYERGRFTTTRVLQRRGGGTSRITIGRARGGFGSAPSRRKWVLRLAGVPEPRWVTVNGRRTGRSSWDAATRTATVRLGRRSTARRFLVEIG